MSGSWDTRLKFAITHPSEFLGEAATSNVQILPIVRVDTTEVVNQTTNNSLNEPHIGLTTTYGEFTANMVVYETSETLAVLDELRKDNQYFDISVVALDEGAGTEWKVEQTILIGCKIGTRRRAYSYGAIPTRTYNITYLHVRDTEEKDGSFFDIDFGDGNYTLSITSGSSTGSSRQTSLETTT